jgi:anti-sigma factor RsiW
MFDCANVEMRELLPDLAAGKLDAATRARVERHVASCAECTSELETLRLVQSAYAAAPTVDVRRIVAALPTAVPAVPPVPLHHPHAGKPIKRWSGWRVAAALTMITVGGFSLAVAHRWSTNAPLRDSTGVVAAVDTPRAEPAAPAETGSAPSVVKDTSRPANRSGRAPDISSAKPQLAFAGGIDDMDDASIKALLGALDEMDRESLAPSAEPDSTPVLPAIRTGER